MHKTTKTAIPPLKVLKIIALVSLGLVCSPAYGWSLFEKYQPNVVVSDPYIELRTGPGRGYPIFYVAGQGDEVVILKRRTDWFKIRTLRSKEGWVHIDEMQHTLDLAGEAIDYGALGLDDFNSASVWCRSMLCRH